MKIGREINFQSWTFRDSFFFLKMQPLLHSAMAMTVMVMVMVTITMTMRMMVTIGMTMAMIIMMMVHLQCQSFVGSRLQQSAPFFSSTQTETARYQSRFIFVRCCLWGVHISLTLSSLFSFLLLMLLFNCFPFLLSLTARYVGVCFSVFSLW